MKTLDFYFEASLLCTLLSPTDNLSKTLQHVMSAAEGQHLVRMTIAALQSVHTEEMLFGKTSLVKLVNWTLVSPPYTKDVRHPGVMRYLE